MKTLLLQMPKVTFTQFQNELARVLGTHQCSKGSSRVVSVSAVGTSSGGEEMPLKSQQKRETKMSALSHLRSGICTVNLTCCYHAENSQMQEFLNPSTLQNIITNALQAAQSNSHHYSNNGLGTREGKPFLGRPQEPQLSAWNDGTTDPEKTYCYCKDTGHRIRQLLASSVQERVPNL